MGSVTWAAADLRTGRHLADCDGRPAVAASLIKLPVMLAVLRRVDGRRLGLDDRFAIEPRHRVGGSGWLTDSARSDAALSTLVRAMIDSSDNAATNVLLDVIDYDEVNAIAALAGMRNTVLARHMMDAAARRAGRENLTTATDICTLLESLTRLLAPPSQRFAFDALLAQRTSGRLDRYLPRGLALGHKTGELDGVRHDAGLVFRAGVPVAALAVLGSSSTETGDDLDRQVAETGRDVYAQLELTSDQP